MEPVANNTRTPSTQQATTARWVMAFGGLVVCTGLAVAQSPRSPQPAVRLLRAIPVETPERTISRAAPPDALPDASHFKAPSSIPAPGTYQPKPPKVIFQSTAHRAPSVPVAQAQAFTQQQPSQPTQPTAPPRTSLLGGIQSLFQSEAPAQVPAPVQNSYAPSQNDLGQVSYQQPIVAPIPGQQPVSQANRGVYAGPPAYRWYGYGGPTPGANPYAPQGQYPRGSAHWYAQTGATPGAFPVPVSVQTGQPVYEPPSYATQAIPRDGLGPAQRNETPTPQYQEVRPVELPPQVNATVPQPLVETPPPPPSINLPVANTVQSAAASQPIPVEQMDWQPATGKPIATTPPAQPTTPMPVVPATPKGTPDPRGTEWGPVGQPKATPPGTPSVSLIRGQAPLVSNASTDEVELIRQASYGRATQLAVKATGPKQLKVYLTAKNETDAEDLALLISRMPELREYAIEFEVQIEPAKTTPR